MENKRENRIKFSSGFTLLEMIVATGIFLIVVVIAMAALLNVTSVQKKTASFRAVTDNLSFSLEKIVREIRYGKDYGDGNFTSGDSFVFTNSSGNKIKYELSDNRIKRTETNPDNVISSVLMTAPEVVIENLYFIKGQNTRPSVTIIINGYSGDENINTKSDLNLQVTVSQRNQ